MNAKLSNILYGVLFSGLGIFSCLLLVNYTELPPQVAASLNSAGAFVFFVCAFNLLGYFTIKVSTWLNNQYALNISKWKIILIYLLVMLAFLLLNYVLLVTAKLFVGAGHPFTFPNGGMGIMIIVWLVELTILGLVLANRSMQNALKVQQHATALQKENNIARYTALQNQLNPHFLFNSLNTLIAEIEYNPGNAIHFTKQLSNVYRYVLQCQDKSLVTLSEELEFMRAYLFLHEVRLGNCITCNIVIPDEYMEQMLPPLTLQLLAENVIKHNSINSGKPMVIHIGVEDAFLMVSNLIHLKKSTESAGIGLRNLSNRCRLMTGKEIQVTNDRNVFIVKIPLSDE